MCWSVGAKGVTREVLQLLVREDQTLLIRVGEQGLRKAKLERGRVAARMTLGPTPHTTPHTPEARRSETQTRDETQDETQTLQG